MAKRATEAEKRQRILEAEQLIIQGVSVPDIVRYGSENWNITEEQTRKYVKWAWNDIEKNLNHDRKRQFNLATHRLSDLYGKNYEVQDYRECRNVQETINGLYKLNDGFVEDSDNSAATWHSIRDVAHTVWPQYQWTRFHKYLAMHAEQFINRMRYGDAPFYIVSVPSQHGKSMLTRYMAATLLSQMPHIRAAYLSYQLQFAKDNGSKPIFDMLFEHQPQLFERNAQKQAGNFTLTDGGGMLAASPDGGLTGRPVDCLLIDDLNKNYMEYRSDAKRRKIRDFLEGTARQRLNNNSGIWMISTRWGKSDGVDLVKEILGGNRTPVIINLPAIAGENDPLCRKPNEPLFPEMHSLESLLATREIIHPLKWAAMYQGNPQALVGDFFTYEKWVNLDKMPNEPRLRKPCRYWDLAFTKGGHGTAGVKMQTTPPDMSLDQAQMTGELFGKCYIQDILEIRNDWPVIQERICRQAEIDGTGVDVVIEANGPQVGHYMMIRDKLEPQGFTVKARKHKPDKTSDAQVWQLQQQQGRMIIIGSPEVAEKLKRNAEKFPEEDVDVVDAISGGIWQQVEYALREGLAA